MKLDVTEAQLKAIVGMKDDTEAMLGGGDKDADQEWKRRVGLINRMLEKNGFKPSLKR